jgi:SNF2 family DNA or RNA helicase
MPTPPPATHRASLRHLRCNSLPAAAAAPAAERDFNSRFGRVVSAARYSKKGSREAEAGTLALDALHKQVMPFILRRTKAQVLQDLPLKIVTDVLCKMSSIQQRLYEDFASSQVGVADAVWELHRA